MAFNLFGTDTSALAGATEEDRRRANEFFAYLAQLQQQQQQAYAQQAALARGLDAQIRGTAPSVAGSQLQQGLGDIRTGLSSQAAGATGQNAALANYGAIQAIGQAQAKANQDAAAMRAQEVAQAQALKANVLAQQQSATGNLYGTNAQAGVGLSGQATQGAGGLAQANASDTAANRAFAGNLINAFGQGALTYGLRPGPVA